MPEGWQWDSTLFRGSAAHYKRGRLPYAPGFAGVLADALGLDGRGRLLDVGCGPGTVTLGLARYVAEAVGLDPDEDMLTEARRRAALRGVRNVRWVTGRAEDLPAGLGVFRALVFAQSFHWTERARLAATVPHMLEPGGAFVHVNELKDPPPDPTPLPLPSPPYERIAVRSRDRRPAARRRPAPPPRTRRASHAPTRPVRRRPSRARHSPRPRCRSRPGSLSAGEGSSHRSTLSPHDPDPTAPGFDRHAPDGPRPRNAPNPPSVKASYPAAPPSSPPREWWRPRRRTSTPKANRTRN